MREQEGAATFGEAIEWLAERFGIPVSFEEETARTRRARAAVERRRRLLDRAAAFYAEYLWRAEEAAPGARVPGRARLRGGAGPPLRVGYAPGGGAVLSGRALQEGFRRDELIDAGLARRRGGQVGDFFTSRIMFPIADSQGRVQGFGGRTLDPNERAKYVNSPEGPHFKKRKLLFGLVRRRAWPRPSTKYFVVVEGYTDVMGLLAAGVESGGGVHGHVADDRPDPPTPTVGAGGQALLRRGRGRESTPPGGASRPPPMSTSHGRPCACRSARIQGIWPPTRPAGPPWPGPYTRRSLW